MGAIVTRTGVTEGNEKARNEKSYRALETFLDLLDFYPELSGSTPLMQTRTANGWKVITRTVATKALRRMVSSLGRDPMQYALHSGRIGGATQLAARVHQTFRFKERGHGSH